MGHIDMSNWVLVFKRSFIITVIGSMVACSHDNDPVPTTQSAEQSIQKNQPHEFSSIQSEQIYQVLLAEYNFHHQNYKQASQIYNNLLMTKADSRVAERATQLAIKVEDYDQALIAAEQWKLLEPDSEDIDQFLVLLYQEKQNYLAAAKVLTRLVDVYPLGKAKPVDIAVALLEQQQDAKNAFHTFKYYLQGYLKIHPKVAHDYTYYLALFAMKAELFEEVVKVTGLLAQIDDKEMRRKTALLRVKAYSKLDKPELALKTLKQLISEAADPVTKQNYARIMASLGQAENAVTLLEQAYDKHPDKAELLLDIIAISLDNNDHEKALTFIDKLQVIKGQQDKARYFRGLVFEAQEKFAKALKEYVAIDKENQSIQVYTRIAAMLTEAKGLQASLSYLHKKQADASTVTSAVSSTVKGKDAEVLGDLYALESETLRQQGQYKEALEANNKAIKLLPLDMGILYSQALLYEDIHQIKKSEKTLQSILRVDANNSAALNALGYMLSVHTTRFDEAYRYIKKAYELRPNDPAIIDSLGWVSYQKGDLKGAERYLRIAYQKLQDPEVASHLVEVLSKQGQQEEANKLLTEMLKKHPENKQLIEIKAVLKKSK